MKIPFKSYLKINTSGKGNINRTRPVNLFLFKKKQLKQLVEKPPQNNFQDVFLATFYDVNRFDVNRFE